MAFLGGLMRGTTGAFLRGSMDAATNMIQASAQRDEEDITERVKGFGAKHKDYVSGVEAFNKENRKITDIAAAIRGQNDDYLKGLDDDAIRSLAQNLITIGGSNPIEFFMNNRDKLGVTQLSEDTEKDTVDTSVAAQTDSAMTTGTVDSEEKGFFPRLFGGAGEAELVARTAAELGISVPEYQKILEQRAPTLSSPTTVFSIGKDDELQKLVKDNNSTVMGIVTKQNFLELSDIKLPDGRTTTGTKFTNDLIVAHQAYSLNKNLDGSPMTVDQKKDAGATLLAMQNFALTQVMPPNVKSFFQDLHGTNITAISKGIGNKDIPVEDRLQLERISRELSGHMLKTVTNQGYASQPGIANQVNELVIEGLQYLGNEKGKPDADARISYVTSAVNDIVSQANSTKVTVKAGDFLERIYSLRGRLASAVKGNDGAALEKILDDVKVLNMTAFDDAKSDTSAYDKKFDYHYTIFSRMKRHQGKSEADLKQFTGEFLAINPSGFQTDDYGTFYFEPGHGGSDLIRRYIDSSVPAQSGPSSQSFTTSLSGDSLKANEDAMIKNANALTSMASITNTVIDDPLVFTAFGRMAVAGATYADIASSVGLNVSTWYNRTFNPTQKAQARQQAIQLVSTAKDALFDDPRLSDQDLRLVLQYIAIVEQEDSFIGAGQTVALAALQGLQTALLKDTAMRKYQGGFANAIKGGATTLYPKAGGSIQDNLVFINLDPTSSDYGKFNANDGSLATDLFKGLAGAYKFNIKTGQEVADMDPVSREKYEKKFEFLADMVKGAVHDIAVYEILKGTAGAGANDRSGSLMAMSDDVAADGTFRVANSAIEYKAQSLEDAKREYG